MEDYPICYGAFEMHMHEDTARVHVYQPVVLAVLSAAFLGKIERVLMVTQAREGVRTLVLTGECPSHVLHTSAHRITAWLAERHPFEFDSRHLRLVIEDIAARDARGPAREPFQAEPPFSPPS